MAVLLPRNFSSTLRSSSEQAKSGIKRFDQNIGFAVCRYIKPWGITKEVIC